MTITRNPRHGRSEHTPDLALAWEPPADAPIYVAEFAEERTERTGRAFTLFVLTAALGVPGIHAALWVTDPAGDVTRTFAPVVVAVVVAAAVIVTGVRYLRTRREENGS